MPRFAASLLIALTGLMALLPQAMCPCSTQARARAVPVTAADVCARQMAETGCCPLCRARGKVATTAASPTESPEAPAPCPCCRMNGKGKTLVPMGDVVRPEPLLAAGLAFVAPIVVLHEIAVVAAGREALPDVLAKPPTERRAGVVLLI